MKPLTSKQLRMIGRELQTIFSLKGILTPKSIDDFRLDNVLSREIRLSENRTVLLTDPGMHGFKQIVKTLHEADIFEGFAGYSDIWGACRRVLQDCLSTDVRPEDGAEFLTLVNKVVQSEIRPHTFVVPLFGVELKGIDEFQLGTLRVVRPSTQFIENLGVKHSAEHIARFFEITKSYLWLIGSTTGTFKIAKEKFKAKAELATGMLAIMAASLYQHGAHGFRIGITMTPEESYGHAAYLSWSHSMELSTTYKFSRAQRLTIDAEMRKNIEHSTIAIHAFSILESESRSALEEAVTRAIYWYSDAHRDEVMVMRLLKYWSCVETFFSGDKKHITQSVATGLAVTLVRGGFRFIAPEEYPSLKKRIAILYSLRSRATHGGAYRHVTDRDVADLSQWISWMLVNILVLIVQGFTTPAELKSWAKRIESRHRGVRGFAKRIRNCVEYLRDILRPTK